nr:hypothetical protein CFP56_00844 [Quercus suber]
MTLDMHIQAATGLAARSEAFDSFEAEYQPRMAWSLEKCIVHDLNMSPPGDAADVRVAQLPFPTSTTQYQRRLCIAKNLLRITKIVRLTNIEKSSRDFISIMRNSRPCARLSL